MSGDGRFIGRYRILDKLGEGGMGVVYRAQDSTLAREVAIKVLRTEAGHHPDRVRRFSQEARAASALNHPNIITVHDAGEFDDGPFLVMELVEGESLRSLLRRGPLPLAKVLDIGVQAATALARAHEGGITHRDLKPENIMIRPDGYIKILDFGLAKLIEKTAGNASEATTLTGAITTEGAVVGTAAYMSPEQATGQDVDGRSDVFSLAVVLFECWQGRQLFRRDHMVDTMHAIVHDPMPVLSFPAGGPDWGLMRILEKALEKVPDERYQTMKDLGIDLRRLKNESTSDRLPTASLPPAQTSRRRLPALIAGCGLLALLAAGGWMLFRSGQPAAPTRLEYTQITSFADSVTSPALSPDGRMLAFIRGTETFAGPGDIYVKLLPDGEPVQLTHDRLNKMSPAFSPGGDRIAYCVTGSMSALGAWNTWTVPVFGGEPARLLSNACALAWIPGTNPPRILFSERDQGVHMSIVTSKENRSEPRTVYAPAGISAMSHRSFLSPDRKQVLTSDMDGGWTCRLAPFEGGAPARVVGPSPGQCTSAAWSLDSKWMYFSANTGNGYHIWRQKFPDGKPEQITFGATEEEGIAFAQDGRSLITSVGTKLTTLWVHDEHGDRQITSEGYASLPQFLNDGKKLYYLQRSHASRRFVSGELWSVNLETGARTRALPDFLMEHYTVAPDGNRIVFAAIDEEGHSPVWLATLDGSTAPRRLSTIDATRTVFGANGDVYFLGTEDKTRKFVYRVKEDGTGLEKPWAAQAYFYGVSPDGKFVAVFTGEAAEVFPVGGGPRVKVCSICGAAGGENRAITPPAVSWSPDGKFLYLNVRSVFRIYAVPLAPGTILPPLPPAGIRSIEEADALPGVRVIPEERAFMGPNPSVYAFPKLATHRNLYRISVP
jgi:serine/threonine protein kinase/Tol biopolymer transport system component